MQNINNNESEKSIIGSILYDPAVMSRISGIITTDDFYNSDNRKIFGIIENLHRRELDLSTKTVWNELIKTGDKSLSEGNVSEYLDYRTSTATVISLATQVSEFSGFRTLEHQLGNVVLPEINKRTKGLQEHLDEVAEVVRVVSQKGSTVSVGSGETLISDYLEMLDKEKSRFQFLGIPSIDANFVDFDSKELSLVGARPGTGKMAPLTSKVLTPTGWKTMGEMKVGSFVLGRYGERQRVSGVFPQGVRTVFELTFEDGTTAQCGREHLWFVEDHRKPGEWEVKETQSLLHNHKNFRIPLPGAATFTTKGTVLRPYHYGADLELGFLDTPISPRYLYNNKKTRLSLLTGIFDTSETVPVRNELNHFVKELEYSTVKRKFALSVVELIRSLGGYCEMREEDRHYPLTDGTSRERRTYVIHKIRFHKSSGVNPFWRDKLSRKNFRYWDEPLTKRIVSVKELDYKVEQQCIMVDSEDHLYIMDDYTVTHNTAIMLQSAAANLMNGVNVGFVSMEMDRTKLLNRMVSSMAEFDSTTILKMTSSQIMARDSRTQEFVYKRLVEALEFYTKAGLFIVDEGPFTETTVSQQVRHLVYEKGCELVYIDYVQLIQSSQNLSSYERVTKASGLLKGLATELDIPIMAAAQLNRGGEKFGGGGKPSLANFKDSGALEQDASIAVMLSPDVEGIIDSTSMSIGELDDAVSKMLQLPITFDVRKQRNGPIFSESLVFDKPFGKFRTRDSVYSTY